MTPSLRVSFCPQPERTPEAAKWAAAQDAGDPDVATAFAGEGIGLIRSAPPAGDILSGLTTEAQRVLAGAASATS